VDGLFAGFMDDSWFMSFSALTRACEELSFMAFGKLRDDGELFFSYC